MAGWPDAIEDAFPMAPNRCYESVMRSPSPPDGSHLSHARAAALSARDADPDAVLTALTAVELLGPSVR